MLKKIFHNKILIYVFSRYFSYFVQFLNSILIAIKLGPFYFGIWGFIMLVMQYLSFGNIGIEYATNVKLSTINKADTTDRTRVISNAFLATSISSTIFLILCSIYLILDLSVLDKYYFSRFIIPVTLIGCLNFFNVLYVNILRTDGQFNAISFFQLAIQIIQLPVIFLFRELVLIQYLTWAIFAGHLISLIIFTGRLKIRFTFNWNSEEVRSLYKRGVVLLFYNVSFYLLTLSTRSLVSYFLKVEDMGLFTFSSNIASAVVLGIGAFEFIAFPKMLSLFSDNVDDVTAGIYLSKMRKIYITTIYLLVFAGVIFYPVLILFFPSYSGTVRVFSLLMVCQLVISMGFAYAAVVIARGKELFLAIQAIIALGFNLIFTYLLNRFFDFQDKSYFVIPLVISFLYYEIQVVRKGKQMLNQGSSIRQIISEIIPLRYSLPLLILCSGVLTGRFGLFFISGLVIFILLNFKNFMMIYNFGRSLILRPEILNISHD